MVNLDLKNEELHSGTKIAASALIGENVVIGEGTEIAEHVIIRNNVTIGKNCKFHPYSVIGEDPQDFSFKGEESFIEIGDNNTFREFTTVHKAVGEGAKTIIGNDNTFMAYSHVGHNCTVGNNITCANNVQLGGHVIVHDQVVLGGTVAIHQGCTVGRLAMVSGMCASSKDMPPFFTYLGTPAQCIGTNRVGMTRAGLSTEAKNQIAKAFKLIYRSQHSITTIVSILENDFEQVDEIKELAMFIKSTKRGIKRVASFNKCRN